MILRPIHKPLFNAQARMAGRYKLVVRKTDGTVARETPWFDNLITNNGLDLIWTSSSIAFGIKDLNPYGFVGTGSSTPAYTDTTLQSYLATGNLAAVTATTYVAGPPPYWTCTGNYRFGTGVAAGNLSEVGVGWATNRLFSRSLIKDSFGNPTTITVLPDEVLDVFYEFRVYPPTTDTTFTVVLNGVGVSVNARSYNIDDPPSIWSPIQNESSNTSLPKPFPTLSSSVQPDIYGNGGVYTNYSTSTPSGVTNPIYVIGSYEINCFALWDTTRANGQNQLWFLEWPHGRMSFMLASPATKNNTQQMGVNYKISWARYP